MTNEEMMKQVIEDDNKEFKKYAEDKLRRVDILREMGYTADQAIKLMTYFCLEEIVNVLVSPEAETVAECLGACRVCMRGSTDHLRSRIYILPNRRKRGY